MYTKNFKTGICSISFRPLTAEQIISLAQDANLDCIEWGSDVHAKPCDTDSIQRITTLCNQNGIYCSSYGTYFKIGVNAVDEIHDYIKAAKLLGTDLLRLWCGNKGSAEYSASERADVISQCIELSKIAEREKVTLCLECHINTLTDDVDSTLDIMQKVDSEHFRMYWQPNQFKTFEQNVDYAQKISKFTKCVHVFNWIARDKFPLIDAKPKWREYLEYFENIPLLLEFMPDGRPESLKTEADSLFEIIGK